MDQPQKLDALAIGYRGFDIYRQREEGSFILRGKYQVFWPSVEMRAECLATMYPSPGQDKQDKQEAASKHLQQDICTCGIYMLEPQEARRQYHSLCYATVAGGGKVIHGTRGYRVEYARIDTLWIDYRCQSCPPSNAVEIINPPEWAQYKSGMVGGLLCREHTARELTAPKRGYRSRPYNVKVSELIEGLQERYVGVEIRFGLPWLMEDAKI